MPTINHHVNGMLPAIELGLQIRKDVVQTKQEVIAKLDEVKGALVLTGGLIAASIFSLSVAIVYSARSR